MAQGQSLTAGGGGIVSSLASFFGIPPQQDPATPVLAHILQSLPQQNGPQLDPLVSGAGLSPNVAQAIGAQPSDGAQAPQAAPAAPTPAPADPRLPGPPAGAPLLSGAPQAATMASGGPPAGAPMLSGSSPQGNPGALQYAQPFHPLDGVGGFLDSFLTGGKVEGLRERSYGAQMAAIQQQNLRTRAAQIAQAEGPQAATMFLTQPELYEKTHEPLNAAAGSTEYINGVPHVARDVTIDPASGRPLINDDNGVTAGPSLGGDITAQDGLIYSKRTGPTGQTYTIPQKLSPGETANTFQPVVSGPGASGPPPGAPLIGQPSAPQPSSSAGLQPRGLRNNNPLNVSALPHGAWNGQTGTDGQYAVFNSPQAGWNAADKNLAAKSTLHGLNTVQGAIADPKWGWDPGNTAYAQTVAQAIGVKPTDPINLQDPAVRQRMLKAMAHVELGRSYDGPTPDASAPAASPAAAAAQPTSTAPQAVGWNGPPSKTNVDIAPADAIAQGLAPGRWQRDPSGKLVQVSTPPKGDLDRIDSLTSTAQTLQELVNEQSAWLPHNQKAGTGIGYVDPEVHGIGLNPVLAYNERTNPDVKAMSASEGKQLFLVKPSNAGARILQSELPYWKLQTQSVDATPQVNAGILKDNIQKAQAAQARSTFYQNWVYQHGNLNGADQAWTAAQSAPAQSQAPVPRSALKVGMIVKGHQWLGGDPANPASWKPVQ